MKPLSQKQKLLVLLSDHEWHSTIDVLENVYGNDHLALARVGARVFDLKSDGHVIEGKKDAERPTIYWYRLVRSPEKPKLTGSIVEENGERVFRTSLFA